MGCSEESWGPSTRDKTAWKGLWREESESMWQSEVSSYSFPGMGDESQQEPTARLSDP